MKYLLSKRVLVSSLFLSLFASNVFAADVVLSNVTVTQVGNYGATGDSTLYLATSGAFKNPNGCLLTQNGLYVMESSTSKISQAILLTAMAAGNKVVMTIDGANCANNRPIVKYIKMVS